MLLVTLVQDTEFDHRDMIALLHESESSELYQVRIRSCAGI